MKMTSEWFRCRVEGVISVNEDYIEQTQFSVVTLLAYAKNVCLCLLV